MRHDIVSPQTSQRRAAGATSAHWGGGSKHPSAVAELDADVAYFRFSIHGRSTRETRAGDSRWL